MDKKQTLSQRQLQISHDLLILAVFTVFYLFFFFLDGAVLHADSHSYLYMDISREPVYPLFLAALRGLFGEESFLSAASFLQNLVNAACSAYLAIVLIREFFGPAGDLFSSSDKAKETGTAVPGETERKPEKTQSGSGSGPDRRNPSRLIWEGLILLILMAPSLLTRFAARRGSTFSCSIMTESLTIPLWLLAFAFFLEILLGRGKKKVLFAALTVILLIGIRKQMLVMIPLFFLVLAYAYWLPSRSIKRALFCIALPAACFLCVALSERVYNYALHGLTLGHTDSNNTIFTIMIYASEPGDEKYLGEAGLDMASYAAMGDEGIGRYLTLTEEMLADPQLYSYGELYGDLILQADREHLTLTYAAGDQEHFSESYDAIAIGMSQPVIEEWLNERGVEGKEATAVLADVVRGEILKKVFPKKLPRILQVYVNSFAHGMCLTVARGGRIFEIYSLFAYAAFALLIVLAFVRWPDSPAGVFGGLVAFGILGNVALTTLVIFCQTRYMIYNMPLFYLALALLLREVLTSGKSTLTETEARERIGALYPDPHYVVYEEAAEGNSEAEPFYDIQVVVPAYNSEATIRDCLNSILGQETTAKVLLTIVDNGSRDRTPEILKELEQAVRHDSGEGPNSPGGAAGKGECACCGGSDIYFAGSMCVQMISQENTGSGGGRNTALRNPMAKYFLFVDSDDLLAPLALEKLWQAAQETGADIVEGSFREFSAGGAGELKAADIVEQAARKGLMIPGILPEGSGQQASEEPAAGGPEKSGGCKTSGSALTLLHGYSWGKLYRASLWKYVRFAEKSWFEDTVVFFLVYPAARLAAKLERTVYAYRRNPAGLSSLVKTLDPKALDTWYVSREVINTAVRMGTDFGREDLLRQLVKQLKLNAERVRGLGGEAAEALFVLQCLLFENLRERIPEGSIAALSRRERAFLRLLSEKDWKKFEVLQL